MTVALLFSVVFWSACNKEKDPPDPCVGVSCENGGTCTSGACRCPNGYEGEYCQWTWSGGFFGDYKTTYTDSSGVELPYSITGRNEQDPEPTVFRWNSLVKGSNAPVPWNGVRCEITDRVNFTFRTGQVSPQGPFLGEQYRVIGGGGKRNEAQTLVEGFIRLQNVQSGAILRYEIFAERL